MYRLMAASDVVDMATEKDAALGDRKRTLRVVLLVDTDNISPAYRDAIAERARRHGDIVNCICFGKSVHGAWTEDGWLPAVSWGEGSLQPGGGRNGTDIDLAITAMDLLQNDDIDVFAIVSGDSDFTPVARRLRRAGKRVVAIGIEGKTAHCFATACTAFEPIYRTACPRRSTPPRAAAPHAARPGAADLTRDVYLEARAYFFALVEHAFANMGDGWQGIESLDVQLRRMDPAIRYRDFGRTRLVALLRTYPEELEVRTTGRQVEVRLRSPLSVGRVRAMKGRTPARTAESLARARRRCIHKPLDGP